MVNHLLEEHRQLLKLADELLALAGQPQMPDIDRLARIRWQLARQFGNHIAAEDTTIRRPIGIGIGIGIGSTANDIIRTYDSGLMDLRHVLADHNARWPIAAIRSDWAGYGNALRTTIAILRKRMAWEEKVAYPLAAQHAARAMRHAHAQGPGGSMPAED